MQGYGGYTWQAKRQINILKKSGYNVIALDFERVLNMHDPSHLIQLVDEVDDYLMSNNYINKDLIIVGVSLGGLIGYNMLRRHKELSRLVVITGGNIALLPSRRALKKKWGISRKELEAEWRDVNMYTPRGKLKNKRIVMMLPERDKVIDPEEVLEEVELQSEHNDIELIRTSGGHIRTILSKTVKNPRSILPIIKLLEEG